MTQTANILPDWIKKQVMLGFDVNVDGKQTQENFFWYLLSVCCPLIFESYAIVLHPFWINWKAKELLAAKISLQEDQLDDSDFKRINWTEFFKLYGYDFNLKTANSTKEKIGQHLSGNGKREDKWPLYVWFPGEGNCETEELKLVVSNLLQLHGDTESSFYYCFLKTQQWDVDRLFKGNLSEIFELSDNQDLNGNPTAIFPNDKSWCIVSDYDLPFTYIGGTKKLIDSIVGDKEFDIYQIEPIFKQSP